MGDRKAGRSWLVHLAIAPLALAPAPALASPQATSPTPPRVIYSGGPIITMDGDTPRRVDAVVTEGGKILFAGPARQARRLAGKRAVRHDLKGATMLPGFIDAHSHFALGVQMAAALDLGDPSLGVSDFATLTAALTRHVERRAIPKGGWVVALRYDQESLAEARHITRAELDAVLPDHKVVVWHVSQHGLVANSAALAAAGITDTTPQPEGGVVLRDAAGRPNGVLFEAALALMAPAIPKPQGAARLALLDMVQNNYFAEGYTHAQDGASSPDDIAFLTSGEARARLKIDLALLPFIIGNDALIDEGMPRFDRYDGHVKLQGVKFVLDGSPQARTAFFTRDYARGDPEGHHPWHGKPIFDANSFCTAARRVHDRGLQLFVHANGDAAIDMAINCFDQLGITAAANRRPVVIHSQFVRPDQLSAYRRIGVLPAFFTNHTHYWADVHRSNFDAAIVDHISPMVSAQRAGLIVSNHSDYPVTPLDTRFQLWTAMTRTSKTGVVSGADQRQDAYAALQALTTGPAAQIFEEDRKGRIKPGLQADFVILDKNPLTTPAADIRAIRVLETVKDGATVWRAAAE